MLLRIFLPFALGYYVSYLFRVVNTVIFRDLVAELAIPATTLGLLTAVYFITFSACQIPLGLLLDRFGPRRISAALMLLAGFGSFGFAVSYSTEHLLLSRALIGVGCSGALMAAITTFRLWFPKERMPALNGWLLACGGLGAMSGTAPVEALAALLGWRGVFQVLALTAVGLAVLILAAVPERARADLPETVGELFRGLLSVVRDGGFWSIGLIFMCGSGATLSLQTLWVAPWLRDVLGMDRGTASLYLLGMNFAFVCGSIAIGHYADRWTNRGIGVPQLMMIAVTVQALALIVIGIGFDSIAILAWMVFHFTASTATLGYALLGRRFPQALTGRAATSANLCAFVAAFGFQFAVGAVLDLWPTTNGAYDVRGYAVALLGIAASQLLAVAVFWSRIGQWRVLDVPEQKAGAV